MPKNKVVPKKKNSRAEKKSRVEKKKACQKKQSCRKKKESYRLRTTHLPLRTEYLITLRRRAAETYPICDDPLSRTRRRTFAPLLTDCAEITGMVFSYPVALYPEWRRKYRVKWPLMIRDVVNEEVKNYYGKLEKYL